MFVQLTILVLCHTALAVPIQPKYDVENSVLVMNLFENFIVKYKRTYNAGEKMQRLQYFKGSLAEINHLNEANPEAVFDINKFSDWSPEELKTLTGYKTNHNLGVTLCDSTTNVSSHDAPATLDWKEKGAVTPAKDQKHCASWAFSATGAVESAYAIKHNKLLSLSEQQLVDCDDQSFGCAAGAIDTALSMLMQEGGQELASDYPFLANQSDSCHFDDTKIAAKVTGCMMYYQLKEEQIKETLFKAGPLSIAIAPEPLKNYKGGILTNCSNDNIGYGALLVGYGTENGLDFWNIKCSWGADWGEQGFFRMKKGVRCLGLGLDVVSATVE